MSKGISVFWEHYEPDAYLMDGLWICQLGHLEPNAMVYGEQVWTTRLRGHALHPPKNRCGYILRPAPEIEVAASALALGGEKAARALAGRVCGKQVKRVRPDGPLGLAIYPAYHLGGLEAARQAQRARAEAIRDDRRTSILAKLAALRLDGSAAWRATPYQHRLP